MNRGALKDPEVVMVELAEYAAPVILLAVVFVLASTRPAGDGAGSRPDVRPGGSRAATWR